MSKSRQICVTETVIYFYPGPEEVRTEDNALDGYLELGPVNRDQRANTIQVKDRIVEIV